MGTVAIYEFAKVIDSGDVIEPNYKVGFQDTGSEDGYQCLPKCLAVQIMSDVDIRLTTDSTKPNALSRFLAANQLATLVFESPNSWTLKFIAA